jgi:diadenosine tetraphosphate (Ap4A) HIT family hydrolase
MAVNEGEVAAAGFTGHVHPHVVPRGLADSNFIEVIADTRALPPRDRAGAPHGGRGPRLGPRLEDNGSR